MQSNSQAEQFELKDVVYWYLSYMNLKQEVWGQEYTFQDLEVRIRSNKAMVVFLFWKSHPT